MGVGSTTAPTLVTEVLTMLLLINSKFIKAIISIIAYESIITTKSLVKLIRKIIIQRVERHYNDNYSQ